MATAVFAVAVTVAAALRVLLAVPVEVVEVADVSSVPEPPLLDADPGNPEPDTSFNSVEPDDRDDLDDPEEPDDSDEPDDPDEPDEPDDPLLEPDDPELPLFEPDMPEDPLFEPELLVAMDVLTFSGLDDPEKPLLDPEVPGEPLDVTGVGAKTGVLTVAGFGTARLALNAAAPRSNAEMGVEAVPGMLLFEPPPELPEPLAAWARAGMDSRATEAATAAKSASRVARARIAPGLSDEYTYDPLTKMGKAPG